MAMASSVSTSASTSPTGSLVSVAIVWCYQSRTLWIPFEPSVSNYIENEHSKLASGHNNNGIIKIDHLSDLFSSHEIDLKRRLLKETLTRGTNFPIERRVCPPDSLHANDAVWEYQGDHGWWIPYDIVTAQLIEDADVKRGHGASRTRGCSKLDLRPNLPYTINLKRKFQTNVKTYKERKIRKTFLTQSYITDTASPLPSSAGAANRKRKSDIVAVREEPIVQTSSVALPRETKVTLREFKGSNPDNFEKFLMEFTRRVSINSGRTKDRDTGVGSNRDDDYDDGNNENDDSNQLCKKDDENGAVGGIVDDKEREEEEECAICFDKLSGPSVYGEDRLDSTHVTELSKCHHIFHKQCLAQMYKTCHKDGYLECPVCKCVHGQKVGNCPAGTMVWKAIKDLTLPGYERCRGTIEVTYNISCGKQAPGHPNPGKPFNARGFPRRGYLPNTDKGRIVLKLLMEAFRRRLMFTVGTSVTTGEKDTVTWNDIHHKTETTRNIHGHGYPDPGYLENVTAELQAQGVTVDCLQNS